MFKTAIFSDIHANFSALKAVLDDAEENGVQNYACLGDIVGYGPNPIDCIAMIQKIGCVCVKGNHDDDCSNSRDLTNLNDLARKSLGWTRKHISTSQKEWLASLPYTRRLGRNLLVHSCISEPDKWLYVRNRFDAAVEMTHQKTPICFFGHTHTPACYEKKGGSVDIIEEEITQLNPDNQYLINVGSVGQPRDGIPEACYVIFDRSARTLVFRRVKYDIQSVVSEINNAGLPSSLGERLVSAT